MTRKSSILADKQVLVQPATYHSNATLVVRCAKCVGEVSICLGPYWRRRALGSWVCHNCRKRELAATAAANPLYSDESYKKKFAELHNDPEYRAKVHNPTVNAKISESAKLAWTRPETRDAQMAHRSGEDYSKKMSEAGKKSWQKSREATLAKNSSDFTAQARLMHQGRFNYDQVDYADARTPVVIECGRCQHRWSQLPVTHLRSCRCPRCDISSGQAEIYDWIKSWAECGLNDRTALKPLEIDIYVPERKLGIEFHGIYWHSYGEPETAEQRLRHQSKALAARRAGVRLLQFYDREWYERPAIVRSMIEHVAGRTPNTVPARRTTVAELGDCAARRFFDANHLSGHRCARLTVCLLYGSDVVMAMSLSGDGAGSHEIIRMATKTGWSVPGGVGRMMAHARRRLGGVFHTYSDLRHSYGNCYRGVGFRGETVTPPGYFYYRNRVVLSRQKCQKHKLAGLLGAAFDPGRSEAANMFAAGYRRCWNAGNLRWVLE